MGWPELWRILASPIIAAAVLAMGYVGLRKARFNFSRLPRRSITPLLTVLMAGASSVVLILLFARPPAPASGQTPTAAPAVSGRDLSGYWIRVYPLENWGEGMRRRQVGEELTRVIIERLKSNGLNARKGYDEHPPIDFYGTGELGPALARHYRRIAPLLAVTGHVSARNDGFLEAEITVALIDQSARVTSLLVHETAFKTGHAEISAAGRRAAEEIHRAVSPERGMPSR